MIHACVLKLDSTWKTYKTIYSKAPVKLDHLWVVSSHISLLRWFWCVARMEKSLIDIVLLSVCWLKRLQLFKNLLCEIYTFLLVQKNGKRKNGFVNDHLVLWKCLSRQWEISEALILTISLRFSGFDICIILLLEGFPLTLFFDRGYGFLETELTSLSLLRTKRGIWKSMTDDPRTFLSHGLWSHK